MIGEAEACEAQVHGTDIVHHFIGLPGLIRQEVLGFGRREIPQRTLCPFNLA